MLRFLRSNKRLAGADPAVHNADCGKTNGVPGAGSAPTRRRQSKTVSTRRSVSTSSGRPAAAMRPLWKTLTLSRRTSTSD